MRELTRLFTAYAEGSSLESAALTAAFLLPMLVLQKPHARSKSKDHTVHLQRRMSLWLDGSFSILMEEGRTIQQHLTPLHRSSRKDDTLARSFSNLMMEGKVKAAIRLLSEVNSSKPLSLDDHPYPDNPSSGSVLDHLCKKHPDPTPIDPTTVLLTETPQSDHDPHFILFDKIDGSLIQRVALKTYGGAGPSGLDSAAWRRLCISFKTCSSDLCNSLAALTRRICSNYVDPMGLSAFVACRLIALDKCPGVRPIGIGETCRRIIGKAVLSVVSPDILDVAGSLQLCAGQEGGCETAVHAIRQIFHSDDCEAVLLVDATNAFNSLNRQAALRNILHLCRSP